MIFCLCQAHYSMGRVAASLTSTVGGPQTVNEAGRSVREWWSEGLREWWSGGVREWWSEGVREWWSEGVRE